MSDDILKTARETLALGDKADRTPIRVNRCDSVAGAIGWQLQQEGGKGEVLGEIIDLDVPKARGTAFYLAHVHGAAPELAKFALLVDMVLRECWCNDPVVLADHQTNQAITIMRRRLGLPSSSLGESGSGEVAGE